MRPNPCVLAYGGHWPDGSVYQCARCMACRRFWRGRSIVPSVQCDPAVRPADKLDDLTAWRELGEKEKIAREKEER